jgi:hypothetical protein
VIWEYVDKLMIIAKIDVRNFIMFFIKGNECQLTKNKLNGIVKTLILEKIG